MEEVVLNKFPEFELKSFQVFKNFFFEEREIRERDIYIYPRSVFYCIVHVHTIKA